MSKALIDTTWKGVPHFRIRADVADSPAWRVLSFPAKALYTDLRAKLRSNNNGNVNATLSELKHRGWTAKATLAGALYQLLAIGFIVKTRGGGVASGSKVCSLYAFTDLEVNPFPKAGIEGRKATFDYRQYQTVAEAKAALKAGVALLRANSVSRQTALKGKKTTVQNMNRDGSDTEPVPHSNGSDNEPVEKTLVQEMNQAKGVRNRPKPAPLKEKRL